MDLKSVACFGVVGNMAEHLAQAGEDKDFKDIKAETNAPKGLFPFYIPNDEILGSYPISSDKIILVKGFDMDTNKEKILPTQVEPECFILFDAEYESGELKDLKPKFFGAFNDASLRIKAPKISTKKNFSKASKGIGNMLEFISFDDMKEYKLSSFLKRDEIIYEYGNQAFLGDYFYFEEKLISFIINKINTQQRESTLEELKPFIAQKPKQILVSIGATSYTNFGESCFLQENDEIFIIISKENINKEEIITTKIDTKKSSFLHQKVLIDN